MVMTQFCSKLDRSSSAPWVLSAPWGRCFQWLCWTLLGLSGATFAPAALAAYNPVVNLQSAQNPSPQGVAINIFAYVTPNPGDPRPTGTIRFFDSVTGSVAMCNVITLTPINTNVASARCPLSTNAITGPHNLVAIYDGDVNYKATASDALAQGVLPSYTVSANAGAGGVVNPGVYNFVMRGDAVSFDFIANTGFHLASATPTGCTGLIVQPVSPSRTWKFLTGGIQFNCNIIATFSNTYKVTTFADTGGRISPTATQNIAPGATTSVTVTPDVGFRLTNVTGCGVVFSGGPSITSPTTWATGAINSDCTVSAFFTALPTFTVTASAGSGGSISPTSRTVPQGATGSFVVSASSGFEIASVSGCGGSLSGITFTTGAITAACTVFASFRVAPVVPPVITTTPMIEYLHPALNYYFITSRAEDIALLDRTPPFVRTGQSFLVYPNAVAGTQPITRFYFDKVAAAGSRGSHFYTLVNTELTALVALNPANAATPKMPFSEGVDSFAFLPVIEGVGGSCAAGLIPVFRLFRGNARFPDDPNHRFTTSTAVYNAFVALGWDGEGVKLCVAG
jgi:Divergent InlB B-repeat domain